MTQAGGHWKCYVILISLQLGPSAPRKRGATVHASIIYIALLICSGSLIVYMILLSPEVELWAETHYNLYRRPYKSNRTVHTIYSALFQWGKIKLKFKPIIASLSLRQCIHCIVSYTQYILHVGWSPRISTYALTMDTALFHAYPTSLHSGRL